MPGQRSTGARRARGSWLPRLVGIAVVVLLAGGGVLAYLLAAKPPAPAHVTRLPTKVLSVQTVGLVVPGPPTAGGKSALQMLLNSRAGLAFAPVPPSSLVTGAPEWTADQMAGGTYIFIYIPSGQCLGSAAGRRPPQLSLRRCDLGAAQRWRRLKNDVQAAGHSYDQFSNLGTGRCLSAGNAAPAGGQGNDAAVLAPCQSTQPWRQLISFWWAA